LAQGKAVQPERVELFAQGAGPAGEGGRFLHANWRVRSTGWRFWLARIEPRQGTMHSS